MGFDKNDSRPVVQPAKRTTKVNISMIAAVLVFFAIAAVGIVWFHHHQP
jgi:flagellar basal body-associated protein FliL